MKISFFFFFFPKKIVFFKNFHFSSWGGGREGGGKPKPQTSFQFGEEVTTSPNLFLVWEGGNYLPKPQTSLGFGEGEGGGYYLPKPNPSPLKPVSATACTKSTTNFDASASTEPTQRHHEVQDQWLLMQGTEVQNKCAGDEAVRTDRTCISLNQRDTLWISWNIGCKLVFVKFCQNVKCTFWHGFARIQIWDRVSIFTENHDGRTVPKVHVLHQSLLSQHHPAVPQNHTNVLSCHTQRDSEVCFQAHPSQSGSRNHVVSKKKANLTTVTVLHW